ncbi:MAG: ABC transporter substrate-binding protein [Longimicrobiales bacterium]
MIRRGSPLLGLVAVVLACADRPAGAPGAGVRPDTGGTAVIALKTDLDAANFLVSADGVTHDVLRNVLFVTLIRYSKELGYEPMLAQSFELQGDTAVVFHLRRDVRWHDQTPTTAHDVAFTFQRAADPATAFPNADWLVGWGAPQVLDSFTVRFALERMADPLASVAQFPIMPKHLLESVPAAQMQQAEFNKKPVGNGPFRFVEYRANDRWVFESNPDYPAELGGRPNLGRLVLRVVPDVTAQVAELRAGNLQLALKVPVDQYKQLAVDSSFQGIVRQGRQYAFIPWNAKRPPLSDARVRRALTLAIDRKEISDVMHGGMGDLVHGPIGRYHWAYDRELQTLPFNPDSARALLRAAGLTDRDQDGMFELPNGKPFKLELKVPANITTMLNMAEMVRADIVKVGITATIRPLDFATLSEQLTGQDRSFDAALMGWENDLRLNFRDMFHSAALTGPYQFASFRNATADSLIDAASALPSPELARPIWLRFQQVLHEQQPWTVLYAYPELYIRSERLQGVEMDIRGAFLSVGEWWIQKH